MELFKKVIGFVIGFVVVFGAIHLIRGRDKLKEFEMFHSEDGRFSVLMPGEPARQVQSVDTPIGAVELTMYTAGSKKSGFAVGYADYPKEAVKDSEPTKMLDGARDGAVNNVGGKLVDEDVIDFNGYPGREVEIEVPGKTTIRARLILIGNRLYQIMVISQSDNILYDKGADFFDSFEINGIG